MALALLLTVLSGSARAAGEIYKWVDEQGVLHITDRLSQVPEPYRSTYAAAERERRERSAEAGKQSEGSKKAAPRAKASPPSRPNAPRGSAAAREEDTRRKWQDLMAQWRGVLLSATAEIQTIDEQVQAKNQNPLLRYTAPVIAEVAELQERRKAAEGRVAQARRMLLVELPERARRENVPQRWLEEPARPAAKAESESSGAKPRGSGSSDEGEPPNDIELRDEGYEEDTAP